ncbi:hypothetical protein NC653_000305 [Populus alba x Populus x berolinensis]|uniref:Uncharacterized protein n=2 Tax=Populus TaxID=3689 RepID=A0AAD6RIB1_9ROSI|nr:hypothetical protein NC653_000305 [Populus alba x Populus x berolinensis]
MGSHVALVKGNRQIGFQVARENRLLGECGSVARENRLGKPNRPLPKLQPARTQQPAPDPPPLSSLFLRSASQRRAQTQPQHAINDPAAVIVTPHRRRGKEEETETSRIHRFPFSAVARGRTRRHCSHSPQKSFPAISGVFRDCFPEAKMKIPLVVPPLSSPFFSSVLVFPARCFVFCSSLAHYLCFLALVLCFQCSSLVKSMGVLLLFGFLMRGDEVEDDVSSSVAEVMKEFYRPSPLFPSASGFFSSCVLCLFLKKPEATNVRSFSLLLPPCVLWQRVSSTRPRHWQRMGSLASTGNVWKQVAVRPQGPPAARLWVSVRSVLLSMAGSCLGEDDDLQTAPFWLEGNEQIGVNGLWGLLSFGWFQGRLKEIEGMNGGGRVFTSYAMMVKEKRLSEKWEMVALVL